MAWFKVDDGLHSHPKIIELSLEATGLWTLAGSWCADYLTDGLISLNQLARLGGTEALANELVTAGLWVQKGDRFQFKDWEDYQPTRSAVKESREKDAQRKKRGRETQRLRRTGESKESTRSPDGLHADAERSPGVGVQAESSGPDPTRPGTSKEVLGASAPRRSRLNDNFAATDSHRDKAKELGVDLNWELEKFKDHFIGKGETKADWSRTFHGWLRRAAEYSSGTPSQPPTKPAFDPWTASHDDYMHPEERAHIEQRRAHQATPNDTPF